MPLSVQTPAQFVTNLQQGITALTIRAKNFSTGSVLGAIVNSLTAQLVFLQQQAQYIVTVTRAATATGTDLTSFVADYYLTPTRIPAVAPQGVVTFTRNAAATAQVVIPVGTIVQTKPAPPGTPVQFQVIADTTNAAYSAALGGYVIAQGGSTVNATVQGILPSGSTSGTALNVLAGQLSSIATTGVPADTVANGLDITNGVDQETDTALRVRFAYYISSLAKSTTSAIASAVANVSSTLTFTVNDGLNAAGAAQSAFFTVVVDDGSGSIPAATISSVLTAVNAVRAAGISCTVIAPTNVLITITVSSTNAQSGFAIATVRAAIQAALVAYVNSNGVGGYSAQTGVTSGKLSYAGIAAVVAGFVGSAPNQGLASYGSITVNSGTTDIALSTYQLARTSSGSVTVS